MIRVALPACLLLAAPFAAPLAAPASAQQRIPIDLGPDAPIAASPPQQIDLLQDWEQTRARMAAKVKECEERRDAVAATGEIVVCGRRADNGSAYLGASDAAWLKDYAERTMNAGTLTPPDVAGPGIFRGEPSFGGMCFIPPCPAGPRLMIDVEAIPPPPAGSDAERVAQGLAPVEDDMAPLSQAERRRKEADLGLPPAPRDQP
jgi:hypothetical protein